ncbi:hypothetical protein HS096_05355 [candidate division WWE3 bacterium]|uniref:Uncharacterized protein n=1 Tax=candidate division WWE3 bacterium TaxID=2053526 RepID=A0A928Y6N2_UNCKA|nr:hypothetical protein [candidate division WWE3 bacterium]
MTKNGRGGSAPGTVFLQHIAYRCQFESLKHRAPVVTSITLSEPHLRLVRKNKDQLNISDILERLQQPSDKENTASDQGTPFSISNIAIQGGHVEFIDQYENTGHIPSAKSISVFPSPPISTAHKKTG